GVQTCALPIYPFGERLGDHRDLVGQPGALGDQATLLLPGRGGDPVDHGGDDVGMVVEPGAGLLVGCGQHGLAQHVAVAGQVVAGDPSDRLLHACLAPRLQAERQARRGGLLGVVTDAASNGAWAAASSAEWPSSTLAWFSSASCAGPRTARPYLATWACSASLSPSDRQATALTVEQAQRWVGTGVCARTKLPVAR